MHGLVALALLRVTLLRCTSPDDLERAPAPLGNFKQTYNVVVTPNFTKGPVSRGASDAKWIAAMTKTMDERFRRY